MTSDGAEFTFKTKFDLTILLGKKAGNVAELLSHIRTVPPASIYHHTHRFLQQHHYLSPEPPNDFAYWVTDVLSEDALGERLWSIDTNMFTSIEELRAKIIEVIEGNLSAGRRSADAPEGQEFYFMASKTFLLPTPYTAHTLTDFLHSLRLISIQSLYYHIFDAHLRQGRGENDFTAFFRRIGQDALADEVARLDPYTQTLDGLKQKLIRIVEKHARN